MKPWWLPAPWDVITALYSPIAIKYFPYFRAAGKQSTHKLRNLAKTEVLFLDKLGPIEARMLHRSSSDGLIVA